MQTWVSASLEDSRVSTLCCYPATLEPPTLPSSLERGKGTGCICCILQVLEMNLPVAGGFQSSVQGEEAQGNSITAGVTWHRFSRNRFSD